MSGNTIRPGDRVHDHDDPDPNYVNIMTLPPMTASEWDVESRDCTLAEDNPDYPDDAAVVVVCFVDDLLEYGLSPQPHSAHCPWVESRNRCYDLSERCLNYSDHGVGIVRGVGT